jgi:hypothetical protein
MQCNYAVCRVLFIIMLSVIMLNVAMLSVVAPLLLPLQFRVTANCFLCIETKLGNSIL